MTRTQKVLIIGASAAGSTTAVQLRTNGFSGDIQLIGDERHLPYDRPPLSKQFLSGSWSLDRLLLARADAYCELGIEMSLGVSAVSVDSSERLVHLSDGRHETYDALVIATGVAPRRLPQSEGITGVHYLRTVDDSLGLRARLTPGARLAVVGGGFVGLEVAATASQLGCEVDVIEALDVPLSRALGADIGVRIQRLHERHGVRFHTGRTVERFGEQGGHISSLRLSDGTCLRADEVVVGVGTVPSTRWLAGSGLTTEGKLLCDQFCRVQPDVYAAGDVALVADPRTGHAVHAEHRANATRHARIIAATLIGQPYTSDDLPFFWTDQYAVKLQMYGTPTTTSQVEVIEEDRDGLRLVATYREDDRLTAVVGWNATKRLLEYHAELRESAGSEIART